LPLTLFKKANFSIYKGESAFPALGPQLKKPQAFRSAWDFSEQNNGAQENSVPFGNDNYLSN